MKTPLTSINTCICLGLFLLACGCDKLGSSLPSDSLEARVDKHASEIMASNTKGEAREWMKNPNHVFFKGDPKQISGWVEEFYSAGAPQVLIGDIEEHEGKQYGESLLVVLPTDPSGRAKLFAIGSRVEVAVQDDPVTDKGQKYLYYSLD